MRRKKTAECREVVTDRGKREKIEDRVLLRLSAMPVLGTGLICFWFHSTLKVPGIFVLTGSSVNFLDLQFRLGFLGTCGSKCGRQRECRGFYFFALSRSQEQLEREECG